MKAIFHLFLLLITSTSIAQSNIDAAFSWDASTIYFTKGNKAVKYNSSTNKVIQASTLQEAFPGLSFSHIDAALDYGNGKIYFFSGRQYTRFDKNTRKIDPSYPKNTIDQWKGVNFDRIDAAVTWPNGKTYFFNGSNYTRYDNENTRTDESYPKAITNRTWPDLDLNSVDAVLNFENGKTYFFKGNQYYRFDESNDHLDEGYPKSLELWNDVQAALDGTLQQNTTSDGMVFSHDSWSETLKKAKASGKLIFVDAYAEWCPPCKRMAANVFPQEKVGNLYNKNFINYKMDCEKGEGPNFLRKYAIEAYPTLLFIDGDGNVVKRSTGGRGVEEFITLGQSVVQSNIVHKATDNSTENGMVFSHDSWSETLKKAKASGKLIFVDAYAEWCPPCKRMAANIFPQEKVGNLYNKNFINYKMDCEKGEGPNFLRKYAIEAYPTLLFIDGDGKVVKRSTGGRGVEEFITLGQSVLGKNTKSKQNLNGTGGTN